MNYNKSQQQAIRHKDGPMLVLAGPGSGKTAVITQRTKQLIEYENIDPSNILVITFTRAAAQEMKQRFLAATGEERTKVTFGTFHAIFFMVLKLAYHFDSGNIISEEQRYQFMREILSYHHLEYRDEGEFIGDVLTEISRVKNEQQDEAAKDYSEEMGKIMTVARRIMHGDIVPAQDEKKLMEFDKDLYMMAKNAGMMARLEKRKKYKSLWDDEEKKEREDPMEAADAEEAFAAGPEVVSVESVMEAATGEMESE